MDVMDTWEMREPEASKQTEFKIAATVLERFFGLENEIRTKRYGYLIALVFRLCVRKYQTEGMGHFGREKGKTGLTTIRTFLCALNDSYGHVSGALACIHAISTERRRNAKMSRRIGKETW